MKEEMFQAIALAKIEGKTMSKREQFAIAALQGLLSDSTVRATPEILVEVAVEYADLLAVELNDDAEAAEEAEEAEEEESDTAQEFEEEDDCDCPVCEARREGRGGPSMLEILDRILKKANQ